MSVTTAVEGRPTIVLVHGAFAESSSWNRVTAPLIDEGYPVLAVANPLRGVKRDADYVAAVLDGIDGQIVLVGHSYGGTVIAEAGRHPAVAHLLYISSYLPDVGQAQGMIMSGESDPALIGDNGDGTLGLSGYDAASFGARFLQDADSTTQGEAWERVTAQSATAFMTPTSAAGWEGVDSTYIVCGQDRSTSVVLQRFHAARATRSVELPTGHHPFISRPDLVVEQLQALLRRA